MFSGVISDHHEFVENFALVRLQMLQLIIGAAGFQCCNGGCVDSGIDDIATVIFVGFGQCFAFFCRQTK